MSQQLIDLGERLVKAANALDEMAGEDERLQGKYQGVMLALSYVDESLRLMGS